MSNNEGQRLWQDIGMSVVPLIPGEKKPSVQLAPYFKRRAYEHEVRAWDLEHYGIVCGAVSGICVVDIDGAEGRKLLEDHGLDFTFTPVVYTPRGRHMYFQHHPDVATGVAVLGKGVDVRSDNSYVVGPGTPGYSWAHNMSIHEVELAPAPGWLRGLKGKREANGQANSSVPRLYEGTKIGEGERNNVLTSWFGTLLKRMAPEMAYTALWAVNQEHFDPPMSRQEFNNTYRSITDRERGR